MLLAFVQRCDGGSPPESALREALWAFAARAPRLVREARSYSYPAHEAECAAHQQAARDAVALGARGAIIVTSDAVWSDGPLRAAAQLGDALRMLERDHRFAELVLLGGEHYGPLLPFVGGPAPLGGLALAVSTFSTCCHAYVVRDSGLRKLAAAALRDHRGDCFDALCGASPRQLDGLFFLGLRKLAVVPALAHQRCVPPSTLARFGQRSLIACIVPPALRSTDHRCVVRFLEGEWQSCILAVVAGLLFSVAATQLRRRLQRIST